MESPVFHMILRSGWIARTIVAMLVVLSVVTWGIIIRKIVYLHSVKKQNKRFRIASASVKTIVEFDSPALSSGDTPLAQLGRVAAFEFKRILGDAQSYTGIKDWSFFIENQFSLAKESLENATALLTAKLDSGVFFLAIISSVAPFIGLFGTVWGIMDSFFEIGNQGSASLPVVAPGIAEALVVTAMGLAVAIPAVFFYNYLIHKVERIEQDLDDFKETALSRLKREMMSLLYGGNKGEAGQSGKVL